MAVLPITIHHKHAVYTGAIPYVCGNSDYEVVFTFDAGWEAFTQKTVRFCVGEQYVDRIITENVCPVPVFEAGDFLQIGVYAGNLQTSTAAMVRMCDSIRTAGGAPADPVQTVYDQIMERLNAASTGKHVSDYRIITEPADNTHTLVLVYSDGAEMEIPLPQMGIDIDRVVKFGNADPDGDTQGHVKQLYVNTVSGKVWICTRKTEECSSWITVAGTGTADSIFAGKKASFYGDSLTEENQHYTKGYHKWVQEILGLQSYNNYGHSGDETEDTINKINSVTDDAHIIFVMIGVNDVQHETELGTFDGLEAGTVYGNLNTICVNLREKYPLTPIVFITPAAQTTYTSDIGVTMYDVVKAVREVCVKNGVVYYDNYTISGISPANIRHWTTDGCHWNDKAHEMVGKNLAHFVKDTFHYLIDREEIEYSPFEGKTLTMHGYTGERFHFTAIVPVDDDFTVGSKVRISLRGTNGVNVKNGNTTTIEIYGDETGICSNNTWTGQFSEKTINNFTVDNSGNVSAENEYTLKEIPTTKNLKIVVYVGIEDLTADASFVMQSLSVTVNGKEKEILNVGGFYWSEEYTIT